MEEFNSWALGLNYLTENQKSMLLKCMHLIVRTDHHVTDEWLIGSLDPLKYEDKNKFIEFSNLLYMHKQMGV